MFYFCVFQRLMCRYRYKHVVTFGGWKEDFMLVVNQSIMRGGNTVEQGTQRLLFVMSRGKVISFVEPTFFGWFCVRSFFFLLLCNEKTIFGYILFVFFFTSSEFGRKFSKWLVISACSFCFTVADNNLAVCSLLSQSHLCLKKVTQLQYRRFWLRS